MIRALLNNAADKLEARAASWQIIVREARQHCTDAGLTPQETDEVMQKQASIQLAVAMAEFDLRLADLLRPTPKPSHDTESIDE